jgi:hypothetical protein
MTRRLVPTGPVPAEFVALAARAADGTTLVLPAADIVASPPTPAKPRWRVRYYLGQTRQELPGGRTAEELYAAVQLAVARQDAHRADLEPITVAGAVERYLDEHARMPGVGRKKPWDTRTVADRTRDFAALKRSCGDVRLVDLTVEQLIAFVSLAGTLSRGQFLCKRTQHFLAWAYRNKLATAALRDSARDHLIWAAPATYRHTDVRPSALRVSGQNGTAIVRSDVPSIAETQQLADTAGTYYCHGDALVQLDAVTGLRFGELVILTADPAVFAAKKGNLVDLDAFIIAVIKEMSEEGGKHLEDPKGGKTRSVVIPHLSMVPTEFDVRTWLRLRVPAALEEQQAGTNPLALIFPNGLGAWWGHGHLSETVLEPSWTDLKWPRTTVVDAHGHSRTYWKFTLHSLRDRYACTAVDIWEMKKKLLLAQGGWESMATVERYYLGRDSASLEETHALLGGPAEPVTDTPAQEAGGDATATEHAGVTAPGSGDDAVVIDIGELRRLRDARHAG